VDASHLSPALETIRQQRPEEPVHGAAVGLGDAAQASRDALEQGGLAPAALVGRSLFLLASRPPMPCAGGALVREQVTSHYPVARGPCRRLEW
jgi:hypothetical protein